MSNFFKLSYKSFKRSNSHTQQNASLENFFIFFSDNAPFGSAYLRSGGGPKEIVTDFPPIEKQSVHQLVLTLLF